MDLQQPLETIYTWSTSMMRVWFNNYQPIPTRGRLQHIIVRGRITLAGVSYSSTNLIVFHFQLPRLLCNPSLQPSLSVHLWTPSLILRLVTFEDAPDGASLEIGSSNWACSGLSLNSLQIDSLFCFEIKESAPITSRKRHRSSHGGNTFWL